MNRKISNITTLLSCALLITGSSSAFDGVTNTIPDGSSFVELVIGEQRPNTTITIESNSTISVSDFVTLGIDGTSTNNLLSIDNNATLQIGSLTAPSANGLVIGDSDGASLIIKNESLVEASNLTMGASEDETSSILIKGENSKLKIAGNANIGQQGDGNEVNVTSGSRLEVLGLLNVGSTNSSNNKVTIDSSSTLAVSSLNNINVADNNSISLSGTLQTAGEVTMKGIRDSDITLNNGSNVLVDEKLTGNIEGGYSIILSESASWDTSSTSDVRIGHSTTNNSLTLKGSLNLTLTNTLFVGEEANDNALFLRDNSKLSVSNNVIGRNSSSNTVTLLNNAEFRTTNNGTLVIGGLNSSANSNEVNQKDNSKLFASNMIIGRSGTGNQFNIKGGTATIDNLTLGENVDANENTATISGTNGLLIVRNQLNIGATNNINNNVTIKDHGTLEIAQEQINIKGDENHLYIEDKGILKTLGWDFNADGASNIVFKSGSTLLLSEELTGTNKVEGGINFVLDGTNALWNSTDNLYIGFNSNENSLTLTNGANASITNDLYIGQAYSSGNTLTVAGAGSLIEIGNNLHIGSETNKLTANQLSVTKGALVTISNDAYVYRDGTLKVDSQSKVNIEGNYKQDPYSTLEIGISSNQVSPNITIGGIADFSSSYNTNKNSIIEVHNEGIGESNIIQIVQAKDITLDGEIATGNSFQSNIASNSLLGFTVSITNNESASFIVLDNFIKHSIGEAGDLDGQLLDISEEIERLQSNSNSNATAMVRIIEGLNRAEINTAFDNYYGEKQSSIAAHNVLNTGIQSVADQMTIRADNTRSRMNATNLETPTGTNGPHQPKQKMQGWVNAFGTKGSLDSTDGFGDYDTDISGFMIGMDFTVAENVLIGLAGGKGSGSIDNKNGSATDTSSLYAAVYASAGTKDWFADTSFIVGINTVDSELGTTFDTSSEYDAQNYAFYMGGGKEFTGDYLIVTPQISMLINSYTQDAYTEKSSNAVGREIDAFDAIYMQSSVGCSIGMYVGLGELTIKPELRVHWLHEWNASDEKLGYNLVGGLDLFSLALQAPEEDILKIGAGASVKITEYLDLRADIDSRRSANYSDFTLLGSLRYQF